MVLENLTNVFRGEARKGGLKNAYNTTHHKVKRQKVFDFGRATQKPLGAGD